jgi:hypothetical protein
MRYPLRFGGIIGIGSLEFWPPRLGEAVVTEILMLFSDPLDAAQLITPSAPASPVSGITLYLHLARVNLISPLDGLRKSFVPMADNRAIRVCSPTS